MKKIIFYILILVFFLTIHCIGQGQPNPHLTNPGSFVEVSSGSGVKIYSNNASPRIYIQLIDLSYGANISFIQGPQVNTPPAQGCFGGTDPTFYRLSLENLWDKFTLENSNAFSIFNGGYFECGFPGCQEVNVFNGKLSYPLKYGQFYSGGGQILIGGNYCSNNKVLRALKIDYSGRNASIVDFFRPPNAEDGPLSNNIESSEFLNRDVFVGISPKVEFNSGNAPKPRNYIGLVDNHTIVILFGTDIRPNQARDIMKETCGVQTGGQEGFDNFIESDGGGSQKFMGQILMRGLTTTFIPKNRDIPQAIGVASGPLLRITSPIIITPTNINQCATATINANIKNVSPGNWNGKIYFSIHKSNDDFISDLGVFQNISLTAGQSTTKSIDLALNTIYQITGGNTYKIYLKYQTNGTPYPNEYPIVGAGSYLNPTLMPVNYSANCNDVIIPPGNYKSVYLSGLNLNPQTNELEFLLQGVPAEIGDIPVNILDESAKIKKRFKQALAISEDNQWISLDIHQANIGNATTGINFQNTDLARDFLEADVKLKMSSVFKPITGFSPHTGTFTDWNNLIFQGPYTTQLQALPNLYYPYWGVFAGIHSKNLNYHSQGPTKIIIDDADMEMHRGILWTELNNSVNTLPSHLRNALFSKINPYRALLLQRLNNGVDITTNLVNSTGAQFQQLRNSYRITAAAHWYKTLANYPNKPYQSLINSNNLSGIMATPSYNDAYWDGQALQPLPHLSETYHYYNNQGNSSYSCVGGVTFGNYDLIDSGAFNNNQVGIDSICFKNKGYVTIDSSVYLYGSILDRDLPELSPILLHPINNQFVLSDTILINTIIYNFGNVKAQNFQVRIYEQYTNAQNLQQNNLIGQQTVALLDSFQSQNLTFTWIPVSYGSKKLFLTVDEGNGVIERRENNNTAIDSLNVLNSLPIVQVLWPAEGAALSSQNVTLMGSAFDYRDGILQNSNLSWSSSIDGFLGNGQFLNIDSLSVGNHTITFTGINSHSQSSFTYRNIYVYPQGFPIVSISSPAINDTLPNNAPIFFSGSVFDLNDGNICNTAVWSSSIAGTLGNGCSINHSLSLGNHTIKLTSTNLSGNTSDATRNVFIVNGIPGVSIIQPQSSSTFYQHQTVVLQASTNDFPQGNISNWVKWYSNIEGYLGTGQSITRLLVPGNHAIIATIQDNTGSIDTAIVSITIKFTAPVPVISQPQTSQAFNFHDTLTLIGHATDVQDGPLHGSHLKWYSNINGFLGFGDTLKIGSLNYGIHIISLKAIDSNNADSTVTVSNVFIDAGQPMGTIQQPVNNASFFFGNSITFKGSATDPQDGLLTGNHLQWSSNLNGNLGFGDSLIINTLNAGSHIITFTATDYDGFSTTVTKNIVVQAPHAPIVSIYHPASNTHFINGTAITLKASATDYEEGVLDNNRVTWSSSINGNLGTGKVISINNLSPGSHIISATCHDTTGLITIATIQIIIEQRKPIAQITAPNSGTVFSLGTNITFTGGAIDFEDGILTGNALQWSSESNVNLGSGNTINTSSLSAGSHLIKLIATDSQNVKDTTTVLVIIQAPHTVLLRTFSSGADSISLLFPANGGDTIIYVLIPKTATVLNAQARVAGRSDLLATVSLTANPSGTAACGSNITFDAVFTNGGNNPSFQWNVNGANVGTNSPTFSSNSLQNGDRVKLIMTSNLNNVSENIVISNTIIISCTL